MKALFERGFSYRSFMLNQPKEIRLKLMSNYIPMEIKSEHRTLINSITGKVKVLGIVEGDCPDTQKYLPVLEKLVSTNANIDLKLLTRDFVKDELKDFEVDGKIKVPTFIFMDEGFGTKGAFVEKPAEGDMSAENAAEEMIRILTDIVKK